MELSDIIHKAKLNQQVTSEEALGKLLGVSGVTVMRWRRGFAIPEPENAQRLAELAGVEPTSLVLETMINSTKDSGLKATLERLKQSIAALLIMTATLPTLLLSDALRCILCKIRSWSVPGQDVYA